MKKYPLALISITLKPQWILMPVPIIEAFVFPASLMFLLSFQQPSLLSTHPSLSIYLIIPGHRVLVHIPPLFLQSISFICLHHHLFALITVILLNSHIVLLPPSLHLRETPAWVSLIVGQTADSPLVSNRLWHPQSATWNPKWADTRLSDENLRHNKCASLMKRWLRKK